MAQTFKIGTRGSKLALYQANLVADKLRAAHSGLEVEIVEINTSGDWKPSEGEVRLSDAAGGKGQFAKEIESALMDGRIDCGVHSMKDMPSFLPDGLVINHILPRADARDAFLSNGHKTLDDLPQGAVVGTASLRRQAFILARRPDLKIVPFRGNVPTRIQKLRDGQVDATLLALAGLQRLELEHELSSVMSEEEMLPAAGQGAIGVEIREGDEQSKELLDAIHCRETGLRVAAERAALQVLDGSCHTPIGAYATLDGQDMHLTVAVGRLDGQEMHMVEDRLTLSDETSHCEQVYKLGETLGQRLKDKIPPELLEQCA